MPSAKTVWGIDVGQCALKALKLQYRDGKLRALGFDVIEHAKILSQPDADEQALIRSALGKFLSRNSIKGSTLVISVPGQASFTRFIKLPPVEMRKIPEIVRYEARQQIPFNLEDVVWDYQTISAPSAGPREVEVGIFAMKRDIVADYVSDFLAMKIEPDLVQMAPVALYNYLRYDKKEGGGATILIDVGAENTNLVIADGDRVWIRNVPLGGNNFTQALCKEFKLPFSKAENLKRHAAESKHAREVFQAMRPVFGDLLTEVQRSIGYYTSLHRDSRVERVVALGNAFRLAGLTKFISQNLAVDVVKVEGFPSIEDAEAVSAPLFRENVLSFGVSFGLAIQGLGLAALSTSLLPPEILSSKVMKRKRPFFVAAGVVLLGAVGAFSYDQIATSGELAGRRDEVRKLSNDVSDLQKKNTAYQADFDKQKTALVEQQKKIAEVEGLIGGGDYACEVLRTVWDAWPYDKAWQNYDPWENSPPRSTLKIIEMLNVSMHYVPDVRAYSETSKGADVNALSVIGGPPPGPPPPGEPPPGEPPPGGAPAAGRAGAPGLLVEITGITPKTGNDGRLFVSDTLIDGPTGLRKCKRTIRLMTPGGQEEILAMMPATGVFRNQAEYQNYVQTTRAAKAKAATKAKGGKEEPDEPDVNKGDDFWFKAAWLVEIGPLKDFQRMQAFQEICAMAKALRLEDPRLIDPVRAKDLNAEALKEIDREAAKIARRWLVTRDDLSKIAAEGVTKEWPREVPGAPAAPPA